MNDERAETLRRLMVDAVEPIHPAPGSQARLQARVAAAAKREPSGKKASRSRWRVSPAGLGWSAAGLSTAVVVVAAAIFFATHGSRTGSSSASSGVGSAAVKAPSPAGAASAGSTHPPANPQDVALGEDLDGDGVRDAFTLAGSTLSVQLSRDGQQQVTLPATGSGARVLGVTQLVSPSGTGVRVVFVRLVESPGFSQDAIAALVDGDLTTLRFGSQPAVLTVDATNGYACSDGELAVSGNPAPYVVQGDQLVASPRLRAVHAAPGEATGC